MLLRKWEKGGHPRQKKQWLKREERGKNMGYSMKLYNFNGVCDVKWVDSEVLRDRQEPEN